MPPRKKKTDTPKKETAKAAKPTAGSLARKKRALIDELKSEYVSAERGAEIRNLLDGDLADVPILSQAELNRLDS